jgi:hypothetical protein
MWGEHKLHICEVPENVLLTARLLTLPLTAKVIYDLDFLNKDSSKSFEVKNFWEF